jgi:uncharacterized protein
MTKFNCTGCGLCCKLVGGTIKLLKEAQKSGVELTPIQKEVVDFPHKTLDDGSCEHLNKDNSCAIYETRPDICKVDKTWAKHHLGKKSKAEYYKESEQACINLQNLEQWKK